MTTSAMGKLLESYLTELEGENGFWRGSRDDVPVFVFSDDEHDRMRLMAPIGVVEELDSELLHVLLQANYDRALDARYAMRNKELWAVVVHPLATLATDDLPSLFDQVVMLVKNTGTTFSSHRAGVPLVPPTTSCSSRRGRRRGGRGARRAGRRGR
jgi:hypothetical protein